MDNGAWRLINCCRALCDHPPNLTDEQLRALGEGSGVVGITFVPYFIDDDAPDLERLIDHVLHAVEQAGDEAVGLGSDFDGAATSCRTPGVTPRSPHGCSSAAPTRSGCAASWAPTISACCGRWLAEADAQVRPYRGRYLPSRYSIR